MGLDVDSILGPGGSIARRLGNYEQRPQQMELARAVADALSNQKHLIAEAGTGVGKSFAYLVPAILFATADQDDSLEISPERAQATAEDRADREEDAAGPRSRRIVVSTHTIALQEQLMSKDLPLLNSVIPREFTSVLVKGRGNYLSRRRYGIARTRATSLLSEMENEQLKQIQPWVADTTDGSLSSLPFRPSGSLWDEVASDSDNCLGKNCSTYNSCFYYQARKRVFGAQILVVNHALFFSDLAVRSAAGFGILPNYDAAILDECHTIENVASDHIGLKVSNGQIEYSLNKLYNPATNKGLLIALDMQRLMEQVHQAHLASDQLAFDLDQWMQANVSTQRVLEKTGIPNPLSNILTDISVKVTKISDNSQDASRRAELMGISNRLQSLANQVNSWLQQTDESLVYWLERMHTRRGDLRIEMHAAPIDVSGHLRENLFQEIPSVIMTSATLSVGNDTSRANSSMPNRSIPEAVLADTNRYRSPNKNSFAFFQSRIGALNSRTIRLGSPFNYQEQAEIIVVRDMPDPSSQKDRYEQLLPEVIKRYIARTDGHAFVLFTSHSLLRNMAQKLQLWFAEHDLSLFSQADGMPRTQLLDNFRNTPRSALFGTDSFWQGVDVPGDALRNVIITKLPFSVPDHPLLAARLDAIRESGGNPFNDYQLPEAVIKLRQGFGRLIRTASDSGIVVLLDSRVVTKPYGPIFLQSLPPCPIIHETVTSVSGE